MTVEMTVLPLTYTGKLQFVKLPCSNEICISSTKEKSYEKAVERNWTYFPSQDSEKLLITKKLADKSITIKQAIFELWKFSTREYEKLDLSEHEDKISSTPIDLETMKIFCTKITEIDEQLILKRELVIPCIKGNYLNCVKQILYTVHKIYPQLNFTHNFECLVRRFGEIYCKLFDLFDLPEFINQEIDWSTIIPLPLVLIDIVKEYWSIDYKDVLERLLTWKEFSN